MTDKLVKISKPSQCPYRGECYRKSEDGVLGFDVCFEPSVKQDNYIRLCHSDFEILCPLVDYKEESDKPVSKPVSKPAKKNQTIKSGIKESDDRVKSQRVQEVWKEDETCLLMMCKDLDEARKRYVATYGWKRSSDSIRHKYNTLDRGHKVLRVGGKVKCIRDGSLYKDEIGELSSYTSDRLHGVVRFAKNVTVTISLMDLECVK